MWSIDVTLIESWLLELNEKDYAQVIAALEVLEELGPSAGRPLVDSVKYSRYKNMKELRPGSSGRSELRLLFAFDPRREAIFLVAGDKSNSWSKWYLRNVRRADELFAEHLKGLDKHE
ncbi:hypothetical protein GCM10009567_12610 [Rothia amarae]